MSFVESFSGILLMYQIARNVDNQAQLFTKVLKIDPQWNWFFARFCLEVTKSLFEGCNRKGLCYINFLGLTTPNGWTRIFFRFNGAFFWVRPNETSLKQTGLNLPESTTRLRKTANWWRWSGRRRTKTRRSRRRRCRRSGRSFPGSGCCL